MMLAERIKQLRKEMGLTQDEFAARLKMHGRQLARYEAGKAIPNIAIIKKIAEFCEVSIDYLVYGHDEKMAKKTRISDMEIVDLLRRVNHLKKPKRDRIKWAIESLLNNGKE